uniref:F-box domain-containing protein n=1 Tax=Steinernema glaseri TaxID=37863 RepID=A0A1I7YT32_9BILA
MDSVPIAFVDTLCTTLQKKDLKELQKIENRWLRTVGTHCSRRRELAVRLNPNDDETEVGIRIYEGMDGKTPVPYTTLTKYDRIRLISIKRFHRQLLPDTISMERFRSKVLPVLSSLTDVVEVQAPVTSSKNLVESVWNVLCAPAAVIETGYTGQKCGEFIERQIRIGYLGKLKLHGDEWPESIKVTLKSFLKSSNYVYLDLFSTLTIDLDMFICIVESFLNGDLYRKIHLYGKPSDEMKELYEALLSGGTFTLLERLPEPSSITRGRSLCEIQWTRSHTYRLRALLSAKQLSVYRI